MTAAAARSFVSFKFDMKSLDPQTWLWLGEADVGRFEVKLHKHYNIDHVQHCSFEANKALVSCSYQHLEGLSSMSCITCMYLDADLSRKC